MMERTIAYYRRVSPKITRRRLAALCIAQALVILVMLEAWAVTASLTCRMAGS